VQQLPLVLVDALHLGVDEGVRVYRLTGGRLQPVGKLRFRLVLGLPKAFAKCAVVGEGLEFPEFFTIRDPALADGLGDGSGERGVREEKPAARSYAIGLVAKALGEHF